MQYDILQLNEMLVNELRDVAENLNVSNYRKLNKQALIFKILDHQTATGTIINQNTAILSPPPPSTTDTQCRITSGVPSKGYGKCHREYTTRF